jgi:sec-independent protein translocase protein TatA
MPGWIGPGEILLLLLVALLVFGPKRLPEMGRSIGKGMREFKSSIAGGAEDHDDVKAQLPAADDAESRTPDRDTTTTS